MAETAIFAAARLKTLKILTIQFLWQAIEPLQ
jgi:hypothetical protein